MSAAVTVKTGTVPNGSPDHISGTGFTAGRTIGMYVNGNWVGCAPTGPFGLVTYGSCHLTPNMPVEAAGTYALEAQNNTTLTEVASTTVTLT